MIGRPMANCCDPRGCDRFFGKRFARRVARRYRKHGLGKTERAMVGYLESCGLAGATVLEVGGGVGELHVELLKRGAERAVNLELSPAYDEEARAAARRIGARRPGRAAAARHRGRAGCGRAGRRRRVEPRGLLLPGLRAAAGRGGHPRPPRARVQLPAPQRDLARDRDVAERWVPARGAGVPRVHPPAGGDGWGAPSTVSRRGSRVGGWCGGLPGSRDVNGGWVGSGVAAAAWRCPRRKRFEATLAPRQRPTRRPHRTPSPRRSPAARFCASRTETEQSRADMRCCRS